MPPIQDDEKAEMVMGCMEEGGFVEADWHDPDPWKTSPIVCRHAETRKADVVSLLKPPLQAMRELLARGGWAWSFISYDTKSKKILEERSGIEYPGKDK